jgi:hypothetical protein
MVAIASYRYKNASDGVVTDLETIDGLRYTRNNNQSITEGVSTTIDFDTVQQNVSGSADPLSSGVLTIPTAGVWRFDFATGGQDGELLVVDEKTEGTDGGDLGPNPITRDLNTVKKNTIAGASLATNTITLPPGTYEAEAYSTIYRIDRCQISLRDTSDNSILVQGISDLAWNSYFDYSVCSARGFFTINTTTNIQLILNRQTNPANAYEGGVGNDSAYGPEIFSLVHLKRVPGNLTLYKTPVATLSPLTYDSPILMGTYDASGGHQLVSCAKYDKIELKYNGYLIANSSDKKVFLSIEYRAGATTARAVGLIADDVTGVIETAGSLTVGNALTVTGNFYAPGCIVQVQYAETSATRYTISSQNIDDIPDLSISFTPKFITSKLLLVAMINSSATYVSTFGFKKDGTNMISSTDANNSNSTGSISTTYEGGASSDIYLMRNMTIQYMHTPNSLDSATYTVAACSSWAGTLYTLSINDANGGNDKRSISNFIIYEIAQ